MISIDRRRVMNSSDTNLENQNTEIKNSKKSNKVLIIILILIILGLGGYICYDKIIMKEEMNKAQENDNEKTDNKEKIVYNPEIISALIEKINLFIALENNLNIKEDWTIYTTMKLSDKTKLQIALDNSHFYQIDPEYYEKEYPESILSKWAIEVLYEQLWGEKISNFENINNDVCPSYEYSPEKEAYYIFNECGGLLNNQLISYVSKVTEGKGAYYLYQSVGMVDYIDDNDNWGGKLYDSVDMKKVIVEGDDVVVFLALMLGGVFARHLHGTFVRLGARVAEKHLAHAGAGA